MLNSSAQPTTAPRTVLVVEDEPTLATAIAQRITAEVLDGARGIRTAPVRFRPRLRCVRIWSSRTSCCP